MNRRLKRDPIGQQDRTAFDDFEILTTPELGWFDLYKLLDVLREDYEVRGMDKMAAARELGVNPEELDRFEYTANSYELLGESARHATSVEWHRRRSKKERATFEAMTLPEATGLIIKLTRRSRSLSPAIP